MSLNERLTQIQPNAIRAFDAQISDVADILKLTLGEPDFNVPTHIKQAAIDSILADDSHYAPAAGTQALREAAVQFLADRYNLQYDADSQVIVTLGATEGIYDTITAVVNPGDRVLIPAPNFPLYDPTVVLAGGVPTYVDTSATDFLLTPDQLQGAIDTYGDQLMAVVLNYPSNPTGVTYSEDELRALAAVFKKHRLWVISDEIYSQLTYDQAHVSLASLIPDQTVLITGLSKSHAMTGYRIGFILGEKAFIDEAQKVHGALTFSLPKVLQDGALVAVTDAAEVAEEMRDVYKRRRDWLTPQLQALGFEVVNPEGAFYIFAKIPADMGLSGFDFAVDLAEKAKVAIIPGDAFSEYTPEYVRISYAASDEDLAEAMKRMTAYFAERRGE